MGTTTKNNSMKRLFALLSLIVVSIIVGVSSFAQNIGAFRWEKASEQTFLNVLVLQTLSDHDALATVEGGNTQSLPVKKEPYVVKIITPKSAAYKLYDNMYFTEYFSFTGDTYQYVSRDSIIRTVPVLMRTKEWKNEKRPSEEVSPKK